MALKGGSRLSAELELERALVEVTQPAEQAGRDALAAWARDEPRGLRLLARGGVAVDRAVGAARSIQR